MITMTQQDKPRQHERGAVMNEYAIATAILVGIFIFASSAIYFAGKFRAESSAGASRNAAPCIETGATPGGTGCPDGQIPNFDDTKCCYP